MPIALKVFEPLRGHPSPVAYDIWLDRFIDMVSAVGHGNTSLAPDVFMDNQAANKTLILNR